MFKKMICVILTFTFLFSNAILVFGSSEIDASNVMKVGGNSYSQSLAMVEGSQAMTTGNLEINLFFDKALAEEIKATTNDINETEEIIKVKTESSGMLTLGTETSVPFKAQGDIEIFNNYAFGTQTGYFNDSSDSKDRINLGIHLDLTTGDIFVTCSVGVFSNDSQAELYAFGTITQSISDAYIEKREVEKRLMETYSEDKIPIGKKNDRIYR